MARSFVISFCLACEQSEVAVASPSPLYHGVRIRMRVRVRFRVRVRVKVELFPGPRAHQGP